MAVEHLAAADLGDAPLQVARRGLDSRCEARMPVEADVHEQLVVDVRQEVRREDLLIALVEAVDRSCKILTEQGPRAIFDMFTRSSTYASGRRVRVDQKDQIIEGVTCGLDESGFLIVREDNGKETTILAGGVRPA